MGWVKKTVVRHKPVSGMKNMLYIDGKFWTSSKQLYAAGYTNVAGKWVKKRQTQHIKTLDPPVRVDGRTFYTVKQITAAGYWKRDGVWKTEKQWNALGWWHKGHGNWKTEKQWNALGWFHNGHGKWSKKTISMREHHRSAPRIIG